MFGHSKSQFLFSSKFIIQGVFPSLLILVVSLTTSLQLNTEIEVLLCLTCLTELIGFESRVGIFLKNNNVY